MHFFMAQKCGSKMAKNREEKEEELISLNNQIHYYIKQKVYFLSHNK